MPCIYRATSCLWCEWFGTQRCCAACGSGAAGFENAVIAKTVPGVDLSYLDQNLAERRCHKTVPTKTSPRRRHHLAATFDHLRHPRCPDPCQPWPQGWQRLLAGIRPGGPPLLRRWTVEVRGWCEWLGARLNPCRPFSREASCVASGT